eukprot:8583136-Alexandrium_andersonii.AAC.1
MQSAIAPEGFNRWAFRLRAPQQHRSDSLVKEFEDLFSGAFHPANQPFYPPEGFPGSGHTEVGILVLNGVC